MASLASIVMASCLFATGGACTKLSDGFTRLWPSVAVVATFVVGAAVLAQAMRSEGLAAVSIVGLGIEAVAAVALGMWLFSERFSNFQVAGVILIVGGTALLRLS